MKQTYLIGYRDNSTATVGFRYTYQEDYDERIIYHDVPKSAVKKIHALLREGYTLETKDGKTPII